MSQLPLFAETETALIPLVDNERGRITYTPRFIDVSTAEEWFAELRHRVEWRAERRMMYDREVDVPRLIAHFRLDASLGETPHAIVEAARRVKGRLGVPFNSVGLNVCVYVPSTLCIRISVLPAKGSATGIP